MKHKQLTDKSEYAGFINNSDLNKKVATLATKAELKAEPDIIVKLQAFDSNYYRGTQNLLVFQPMHRYFLKIGNSYHISSWKSKGLSDESIKRPTISDNSLTSELNYIGNKIRVNLLEVVEKKIKLHLLIKQ